MTLTKINKAGLDELALDHVFTIGASGSSAYTFQGEGLNGTVNNPTLYLTRGKTYRFENGTGAHPIRIQSTSGASGTAYNTGVTNNAGSGTVIVEVQHDAPDVLYYQCTSHAAMNGILYITGALADGGVTTAKIADNAITGAKMGTGSVGTTQIVNGAITGAKMGNGSVGTNQIVDQAVTLAKLPHGNGSTDGKFLRANNGADPTFETVTGTTINNNADNRVITGSGTANTLNGESKLTFDGNSNLTLDAVVTVDRVINATDSADPWLKGVNSSNTETAYIKPNGQAYLAGNVGIGTSSPSHKLHVESSASGVIAAKQTTNNGGYNTFEGKDSSGNVKFYATHNGRVGAADGIIFGSDTAAANILDDYEEGTWQPSFYPQSSAMTHTYGLRTGTYVKIGRVVYWAFRMRLSALSGQMGQTVGIAGFPYTIDSGQPQFSANIYGSSYSGETPTGIFYDGNTTRGTFYYYKNNVQNVLYANDLNPTNSYTAGTGFYFAA